jgi:hypothetical protein
VVILKLPLPLPLLQTAIMEIHATLLKLMLLPIPLKPADSSNLSINRLEEVAGF